MADAPKSIFAGLKDAKARISANYVRQGHYLMRYDKIKTDKRRKGDEFMVFEMTVMKVLNNDEGKGHRVGEAVSHMLMATNDCFLGNVKTIIANVLGMKPEDVSGEDAELICDASQPLCKGTVVEIKARTIRTRPSPAYPTGRDFTEVNHVREVPAVELMQVLDPKVIADFFPGDMLGKLAAATAAQAPAA